MRHTDPIMARTIEKYRARIDSTFLHGHVALIFSSIDRSYRSIVEVALHHGWRGERSAFRRLTPEEVDSVRCVVGDDYEPAPGGGRVLALYHRNLCLLSPGAAAPFAVDAGDVGVPAGPT